MTKGSKQNNGHNMKKINCRHNAEFATYNPEMRLVFLTRLLHFTPKGGGEKRIFNFAGHTQDTNINICDYHDRPLGNRSHSSSAQSASSFPFLLQTQKRLLNRLYIATSCQTNAYRENITQYNAV